MLTNVDALDPIWVYFNISDNQRLKVEKEVKNHTLILPKDDNFDVEVILSDGSLFPARGKVNLLHLIMIKELVHYRFVRNCLIQKLLFDQANFCVSKF